MSKGRTDGRTWARNFTAKAAATFERVTGIRTVYEPAYTREALVQRFPAIGDNEDLVRELLGMAEYAVEYGYFGEERDLAWSRQVDPQALT